MEIFPTEEGEHFLRTSISGLKFIQPDFRGAKNCKIDLKGIKLSLKGVKYNLKGLWGESGVNR